VCCRGGDLQGKEGCWDVSCVTSDKWIRAFIVWCVWGGGVTTCLWCWPSPPLWPWLLTGWGFVV
jgi:hypothetical protein